MIGVMAGKTPLLLAVVLFAIGASGLALTSADRASWGPWEPRSQPALAQRVIVVDAGTPFVAPSLDGLLMGIPETAIPNAAPQFAYAPEPEETPEPTPTLAPLRVFGISADDGGVSAAAVTPAPPPPLRAVNVASDDGSAEPMETPEATVEPEATETPEESAEGDD